MNHSFADNTLTIFLSGRIDTTNAPQIEGEIDEIRAPYADAGLILDAEKLEYLSSAGLRVILRLRKGTKDFKIINVNTEVYEIFELTGFSEMMPIEKAYRKMSVDGCKVLGEGSNGVVYRYDDELVIKVYRNPDALDDIRRERELARKALILGIPTAIPFDVVKVGDKFASVFELLDAKSFSWLIAADPDGREKYIDLFVELLQQIHSTEVNPADMPDMKKVAVGWCTFLKDYLPEDTYDKLITLVNAVPDRNTMIHGDYHTNNVEMQKGEVLLIDMDTLSHGHPVFELASSYLGFVGFGELDGTTIERFLKIPYDLACKVWKSIIRKYLRSDDEAYVTSVENKARIIGYVRLMRRTIRRGGGTPEANALIAHCRGNIIDLLKQVDSLDF